MQGLLAIGDRTFESEDTAWQHITAVKGRLLGRRIKQGDPDFE